MINDSTFEAELREVFLNEADEMLEEAEATFIQVETNPNDRGKIDKIFRLIHTIKGSAHVAGFSQLGDFAHKFETLLSAIRDQKVGLSCPVVDVLLACNDKVRDFVAQLRLDPMADVDCQSMVKSIDGLLTPVTHGTGLKALVSNDVAASPIGKLNHAIDDDLISAKLVSNSSRTFLICDDEPAIGNLIAESLRSFGHTAITTTSAIEGLDILRQQQIDAIFCDVRMPEMSGIKFVETVRAFNRFVPIVIISGHTSRDNMKSLLNLGVDRFLDKPFTSEDLRSAMRQMIREKSMHEAIVALSRLSFQVSVSVEKIFSLDSRWLSDNTTTREKKNLDALIENIRLAAGILVRSERMSAK